MKNHPAYGSRRKCALSDDDEMMSATKAYHSTALRGGCSDESLGTRSLPVRNRSSSPAYQTDDDLFGTGSFAAAAFTDVPFLDPGRHEFEHTLAIIKPEAARLMYKIEAVLARNEFIIIQKKALRLSREQAAEFYGRHSHEPFFPALVGHVSGGPVVVYVLAKRDGVAEWRRLIGPADVRAARADFPLSLRAVYGTRSADAAAAVANAFHGSDSPEAARREIRFFFPEGPSARATGDDHDDDDDDVERYIYEFLMPEIDVGLSEMFRNNPIDPLRWFGNWLLDKK